MNKIAIVSSIFGGMDRIKPVPNHAKVDTILFTDTPKQWDIPQLATWDKVIIENKEHTWKDAKYIKQQLFNIPILANYDYLVWVDGSIVLHGIDFLIPLCNGDGAKFTPHSQRKTVEEEYAFVCQRILAGDEYLIRRYDIKQMSEQMEYIGKAWHEKLWVGGFFIVNNNERVKRSLDEWWKCTELFGMQDQLSLTFAFSSNGVEIENLGFGIYNEYFHLEDHLK